VRPKSLLPIVFALALAVLAIGASGAATATAKPSVPYCSAATYWTSSVNPFQEKGEAGGSFTVTLSGEAKPGESNTLPIARLPALPRLPADRGEAYYPRAYRCTPAQFAAAAAACG
jgi:hypothetical protein